MLWIEPTVDEPRIKSFSQQLGITPVTAALLWTRGMRDPVETKTFLEPRLADLGDPFALTNMSVAIDRLQKAMAAGESILVYGDYDVDGVTSTALLISILNQFGIEPKFFVPHRLEEGYGLSIDALDRALLDGKPDLLVAVDCGTGSRQAVKYLRDKGIDVIILDHHASKEELPEDCILVNPHVHDSETAPWVNLSAVGIVFKFIHALFIKLRSDGDDLAHELRLKDYLDLVALGTICDLVPLTGENRILASHGLKLIQKGQRVGICALLQASGWRLGDEISPFDVSFRIGPRINASGRLAEASMPIHMLISDDWQFARESARQLDDFNRERQDIERSISETAVTMVQEVYSDSPGLVLYNPDWHSGVVGIVASRIANRFHRPTLVLGREGDEVKGSGRSVDGVDLVDILKCCEGHLAKWGGHPMAVGFSLVEQQVEGLRKAFCDQLAAQYSRGLPEKQMKIDCWVQPEQLNETLLKELSSMEPFGQQNPEPVFALRNVRLNNPGTFGNGHMRFQLATGNGQPISGVAWGRAGDLENPQLRSAIDLAFRFHWNNWNGRKSARLTLVDWRPNT
jgi:single-stranded-DNA-specific exonuclease